MGKSRFALATIALVALLTACADAGGSTAATEGAAATVASNGSAPAALQFSAPAVGGGAIDFTQFAGKPVVLWFWAPT